MISNGIDLWPDDLRLTEEESPAVLTRQQAELLGKRMDGRVEG